MSAVKHLTFFSLQALLISTFSYHTSCLIFITAVLFLFLLMSEEIMKLTNTLRERLSYDLETKTSEQNRNNKQMEIERFDWFIE